MASLPSGSSGFVRATTDNLPSVDIFMITNFLKRDDRFNSAEIKGVKTSNVSRESYGDNAIGYVELKREASVCTVAKICPEHKIRNKNYAVQLIVDEAEEKILDVLCNGCAASAGGCKHALAFLMWCHRRSEEPSPTEVECYWKKPRLSHVTSKKFVEVKEFLKDRQQLTTETLFSSEAFVNEVVNLGIKKKITSHITSYRTNNTDAQDLLYFSLQNLMYTFKKDGKNSVDEFISYIKFKLTDTICVNIERNTRNQHDSPLWHELRFGRITASKLFEVSRCKTAEGSLVETIIGASKVYSIKAIERGRKLEKEVLKELQLKLGIGIEPCGFLFYKKNPIFGASPDGICEEAGLIVEVKCPLTDKTVTNYVKDGVIHKKYLAQMQLQMLVCNLKKGIFCVANPKFETTKEFEYFNVDFDEEMVMSLLDFAEDFWKRCIFPKIYESV